MPLTCRWLRKPIGFKLYWYIIWILCSKKCFWGTKMGSKLGGVSATIWPETDLRRRSKPTEESLLCLPGRIEGFSKGRSLPGRGENRSLVTFTFVMNWNCRLIVCYRFTLTGSKCITLIASQSNRKYNDFRKTVSGRDFTTQIWQ